MIPVIINNRDLLTWPRAMVERIKRYDGVGEIIILDNGSTYEPLLEWYETKPCKVIRGENIGHTSPWAYGVVRDLKAEFYVVTDSDLGLDKTPDDTLLYLLDKEKTLNLGKVGLGLSVGYVSPSSPYYNHIQHYEIPRWTNSRYQDEVALDVAIDTTFALYSNQGYFIGGGSTYNLYKARHYPWELTKDQYERNLEFRYYIEHASNSSSYKWFLGL